MDDYKTLREEAQEVYKIANNIRYPYEEIINLIENKLDEIYQKGKENKKWMS